MRIPIGYKFILGFAVVVGAVGLVPAWVARLDYAPEITNILTYLVAMTIGLVLGVAFSRSFAANISRLTRSTEAISQGDLTHEVVIGKSFLPDETHDLAHSVNLMAESLRELVRRIKQTAGKVTESAKTLSSSSLEINASTEEVAQAMEQISKGAETQSEMVEKSSKAIREMAISIELVATKAKEAAKSARETSQTAQRGGELAKESLERTKGLLDVVELSGQQFQSFNAKLQHVGKIADFISDIARQTNLLALNASIEAARAGEYGKGFAVVADEVRKLAEGTAKSAAEIIELLGVLKDESRKVQETIAEGSRHVSEGKRSIDTTATTFQEIVKTVLETERKANSIADLSQMQTDGAEKMVQAVDEIAKVAEDNAASTEQVSAATEEQSAAMQEMTYAAQELSKLAEELMQVVMPFKVNREETLAYEQQ